MEVIFANYFGWRAVNIFPIFKIFYCGYYLIYLNLFHSLDILFTIAKILSDTFLDDL